MDENSADDRQPLLDAAHAYDSAVRDLDDASVIFMLAHGRYLTAAGQLREEFSKANLETGTATLANGEDG